MRSLRRVLALVLLAIALAAVPLRADVAQDIDAFARKAMREIGTTPGLAVVVVKDDAIVYRGDFGVRDVERGLPVTPETRFYLASSTKAFFAMAAATLAAEGKLDLDAPIGAAWPGLALTPPLDPSEISLRDLLAMRSGLANDTLNFRMEIGNVGTEEELLRLLKTYSRREPRTFRYSNLNYVLAGRVVEKTTGEPWPELVTKTILLPLGMTSTLTARPDASVPVATCYLTTAAGTFAPTPAEIEEAGPAGAMLTTTGDAAKWLLALLHEGRAEGRQVLPARAVRMAMSEQTTQRRQFRYFARFAWGLGQDLADYEGNLLVHRFGGLNGAYSHISFMPERGLGVAVFANGGGAVPDAVAAYAYDRLLGRSGLAEKWSAELAKASAAAASEREARAKNDAAVAAARRDPAHPASAYAATYHSDRLGDIRILEQNARLYAQLGIYRAELVPAGGDAFTLDWTGGGRRATLRFVFDGAPERAARIDWDGRIFDRR